MPAARERTFTKDGLTTVTTDATTAAWLLAEGWTESGTGTPYVPPSTPQQLESRVDALEAIDNRHYFTPSWGKQNFVSVEVNKANGDMPCFYVDLSPGVVFMVMKMGALTSESTIWRQHIEGSIPVPIHHTCLPAIYYRASDGSNQAFSLTWQDGLWWPLWTGQNVASGNTSPINVGDQIHCSGIFQTSLG